ncbi:DUF7386 family protein [Haloparvum sp. AD34]
MGTELTTLRLSDERKQLLDEATEIVSDGPDDDPPRYEVIDAAHTCLSIIRRMWRWLEASWSQRQSSSSTPMRSRFTTELMRQ